MSRVLEPRPTWSSRWFGIVVRVVMAVVGVLSGALVVWGGFFAAYFATPDQPDWDAASVAFLVFGFAVIEGSIWLGVRPSRASALTLVAIIAAAILVLSLV